MTDSMPTTDSLRALLSGAIDYAGLFPPAQLPMDQAYYNHVEYLLGPHAWMLGRFVCPLAKLTELARLGPPPAGFRVTVVAQEGLKPNDFAQANVCFLRDHADMLEMRMPARFAAPVELTVLPIAFWPGPGQTFFYEPPPADDWQLASRQLITLVARQQATVQSAMLSAQQLPAFLAEQLPSVFSAAQNASVPSVACGFKLRTGGLQSAAFPTVEQVAFTIVACRDAKLIWKATAGLHHPLRHFDPVIGVWAHGFLNVFTADVMAQVHALGEREVQAILESERIEDFRFEADALRWRDYLATTEQIASARRAGLVSFGSCSFSEPIADLQSLGLLL